MRDILIHAQFEHLRIDHDHPALVRSQPVQQRQDHAIEPDRFARSGGAGNKQMRHRREIGNHWIAGDILSQHEWQRGGLILEGLRPDQLVQPDRFASRIGQFDADHGTAWNRRDARGDRRHVARDIVGELDYAACLDPRCRFQLVHRHHRPRPDIDDRSLDVEIVEHRFEQPGIAFQRCLIDRPARCGRCRLEQVQRRQLRIVAQVERGLLGLGLGDRGGE